MSEKVVAPYTESYPLKYTLEQVVNCSHSRRVKLLKQTELLMYYSK